MILLNFAHPLTADQVETVHALSGDLVEVREVVTHLDLARPLAPQIVALADACELDAAAWQTEAIILNPPSLGVIAAALLAELHGRMGYFAPVLQMRAVSGIGPRYEVAAIVNLQDARDAARARRASGRP